MNKNIEDEDSVENKITESQNDDTGKENTSISEAGHIKDIPSIADILPDSDVFALPLLNTFLGGAEKKEAVLEKVELVHGSYSDFIVLFLDGERFRSNSKTVMSQVEQLQKLDMIPVKVVVAEVTGKGGRSYFTLNG